MSPGVRKSPADASGDILREAWRPKTAEPVAIHVRPELCARLVAARDARPRRSPEPGPLPPRRSIPLVVDDRIPTSPGFEVHRAAPGAAGVDPDRLELGTGVTGTAPQTLVLDPSGACVCTTGPLDRAGEASGLRVAGPVCSDSVPGAARRGQRGHR